MESDVLRRGNFPADYARRQRKSRPDRILDQNNLPLNPLVGWSIALLVSAGLWWGIEVAVSSLFSVVLQQSSIREGRAFRATSGWEDIGCTIPILYANRHADAALCRKPLLNRKLSSTEVWSVELAEEADEAEWRASEGEVPRISN